MREDGISASIVRVERLTPELARRLVAEADVALYGDGRCSLDNMQTSCFASEACNHQGATEVGVLRTKLSSMCDATHAYVALVEDAKGLHFVGCVQCFTADRVGAGHTFPNISFSPNDLFLYSLCVADTYRRHGAGRMLIDKAIGVCTGTLYLTVALPSPGVDETVQKIYDHRVARLRKTYGNLHFVECATCPQSLLMKYIP